MPRFGGSDWGFLNFGGSRSQGRIKTKLETEQLLIKKGGSGSAIRLIQIAIFTCCKFSSDSWLESLLLIVRPLIYRIQSWTWSCPVGITTTSSSSSVLRGPSVLLSSGSSCFLAATRHTRWIVYIVQSSSILENPDGYLKTVTFCACGLIDWHFSQCFGSGSVLDSYSGALWSRIRIPNADQHMQI